MARLEKTDSFQGLSDKLNKVVPRGAYIVDVYRSQLVYEMNDGGQPLRSADRGKRSTLKPGYYRQNYVADQSGVRLVGEPREVLRRVLYEDKPTKKSAAKLPMPQGVG